MLLVNKSEVGNKNKQQIYPQELVSFCFQNKIAHNYEVSAALDINIVPALMQIAELGAEMENLRRGVKVIETGVAFS